MYLCYANFINNIKKEFVEFEQLKSQFNQKIQEKIKNIQKIEFESITTYCAIL